MDSQEANGCCLYGHRKLVTRKVSFTRKNSVLAGSLTVIMIINVHFTVCKALRCILLFELRGDILGHD